MKDEKESRDDCLFISAWGEHNLSKEIAHLNDKHFEILYRMVRQEDKKRHAPSGNSEGEVSKQPIKKGFDYNKTALILTAILIILSLVGTWYSNDLAYWFIK